MARESEACPEMKVAIRLALCEREYSMRVLVLVEIQINALGPILSTRHLTRMMVTKRKLKRVLSIFVSLSARVGSIGDNHLFGSMSYRMVEAAQN